MPDELEFERPLLELENRIAELRAAAGPNVPIVGMTIYNPFLAYWFAGPDGQAIFNVRPNGAGTPVRPGRCGAPSGWSGGCNAACSSVGQSPSCCSD